jgi:hypothetical protein
MAVNVTTTTLIGKKDSVQTNKINRTDNGNKQEMCKAFSDKYRNEVIRKQNRRKLKAASWRAAVAVPARVTSESILFTAFTPVNSDINTHSMN